MISLPMPASATASDPMPAGDADALDLHTFVRTGDRTSLARFWQRHADEAWRCARWICGDRADDALQEAALAILRQAHGWRDRGPGSARAWLFTVVGNAARKQRRRDLALWRRMSFVGEIHAPEQPAPEPERWQRVHQALDGLARHYRQAVELRYLAGLDFDAVAAAQGIPERTARTRVSRGLEHLRRRLGVDPAVGSSGAVLWMSPLTMPSSPGRVHDLISALPAAAPQAAAAGWLAGLGLATLTLGAGVYAIGTLGEPAPQAVSGEAPPVVPPVAQPAWLDHRCAQWPAWPLWDHPQMQAAWIASALRRQPQAPSIRAAGLLRFATRTPAQPTVRLPEGQDATLRAQLDTWSQASGGRWELHGDQLRLWKPLPQDELAILTRDLAGADENAGAYAARRMLMDGDPAAARLALAALSTGAPAAARVLANLAEVLSRDAASTPHPPIDPWAWWREDADIIAALTTALQAPPAGEPSERRWLLAIAGRLGIAQVERELIDAAAAQGPDRAMLLLGLAHVQTPGVLAWFAAGCAAHDREVARCIATARLPSLCSPELLFQAQLRLITGEGGSQTDELVTAVREHLAVVRRAQMGDDHERDAVARSLLSSTKTDSHFSIDVISALIDRPAAGDLLAAMVAHKVKPLRLSYYQSNLDAWDLPTWLAAASIASRQRWATAAVEAIDTDSENRLFHLSCAAALGDRPARQALLAYRPTEWQQATCWSAALALWGHADAIHAVRQRLEDPTLSPETRQGLMRGCTAMRFDRLGTTNTPFWDLVRSALDPDEHRWIRSDAAGVLGVAGPVVEPALVEWQTTVANDHDGRVAGMAGILFMEPTLPGRARFLDMIMRSAQRTGHEYDEVIRWNAAIRLGWAIGQHEAHRLRPLTMLLDLTSDPHPVVRRRAYMALADLSPDVLAELHQGVLTAFQRGLSDPSPLVRLATSLALSKQTDPAFTTLRTAAASSIGTGGSEGLGTWREYYKDPTPMAAGPGQSLPGLPPPSASAEPATLDFHLQSDDVEGLFVVHIAIGPAQGLRNPTQLSATAPNGTTIQATGWAYRAADGRLHIDTAFSTGLREPPIPCLAISPDGVVECFFPHSRKRWEGRLGLPAPPTSADSRF